MSIAEEYLQRAREQNKRLAQEAIYKGTCLECQALLPRPNHVMSRMGETIDSPFCVACRNAIADEITRKVCH